MRRVRGDCVATFKHTVVTNAGLLAAILATPVRAADTSPAKWTAAEREQAEKRETAGWAPEAARTISSKNGVVSAIASPIAVQAGVIVLREGGTAADAAAAVALTEITTQLGSGDGTKIILKRQLHKSVIEVEPPKDKNNQQVAGVHTHVLDDIPEDTDVFHVLTRKPSVPEMVITKQFVFQVDPDGSIKYVGKSEDVLKQK
jgi:hypothetical protein